MMNQMMRSNIYSIITQCNDIHSFHTWLIMSFGNPQRYTKKVSKHNIERIHKENWGNLATWAPTSMYIYIVRMCEIEM